MNTFGGSFSLFNPLRFNRFSLVSKLNSQGRFLMFGLSLRSREVSVVNVQMRRGTLLN